MKSQAALWLATFSILMITTLAQAAAGGLPADLILINAKVRTMDENRPAAEAIAIRGSRIAALGNNEEVRALAGPQTRTVDAQGRLVLPGFNDAHVHFLSGGFQLSGVDLRDAATQEEFSERIRRFAR